MALPLAQAAGLGAPLIEVVDAAALKGAKRVAVTSFTVHHVTSRVWDASFTSGGAGYGVKGPGGSFVGTGIRQTAGQGGGFDIEEAEAEKGIGAGAIAKAPIEHSPCSVLAVITQ